MKEVNTIYRKENVIFNIYLQYDDKLCIYLFTGSPAYMEVSNNIDDEPSLDSTTIHSTMQGSAGSDVIMDSTLDSSDLANLHSGMNNSDLATLHPVTLNMSRDIMHAQQGNQASCSSSVDGGY